MGFDYQKGKNVLSLFDGMSNGMIALERTGINVGSYFASEVDRYSQKVSQNNYPDIIRLGDVRNIDLKSLPEIDILIGGSPCQSFSFAGKMAGMSTRESVEITTLKQYLKLKKEGFEFNGQSYLFWEYVRILKEVKPKFFLLENVKMLKKWQDIISDTLGVEPILINSNLVSAQNRKRLYWTNIPNIEQPKDKGILLRDILDDGFQPFSEKVYCLTVSGRDGLTKKGLEHYLKYKKDNFVFIKTIPHGYMKESLDGKEKYPSLCAQSPASKHLILDGTVYRKLSPNECEKLQTVPLDYTKGVSDTQRYKMLGNGWTVDVIAHIFSYLPKEYRIR